MADITLRTQRPHKVYTRAKWADEWEEQENFFCDRCTFACGPAISSAEFTWTAGRVMSYTEKQFFDRPVKEFVDKYVKVEINQGKDENGEEKDPILWYGVFVDDDRAYGGQVAPTLTFSQQRLLAYGLEWLLERTILDSSFVLQKQESGPDEEIEVERAISFNEAGGNWTTRRIKGNQGTGSKGAVFAASLEGASEWSGQDIIQYLINYHPPKDKDGNDQLGWKWDVSATSLAGFKPIVDMHGASVKQVLDAVADRRRLVGWKIEVNDDEKPAVSIFRFNESSITLPGGETLDPNEDTVTLDFAEDGRVLDLVVGRDASSKNYRRVIARGERVVVIGSMSYDNGLGEFDKDWNASDESLYETAAHGSAGYASLDDDQKRNANEEYRNQDKFERVYRYFKVKHGKVPDWMPAPDDANVNSKPLQLWAPGGRFLATLPLQTDVDYTTPSTSLTASLTTDGREDFLPPMVFVSASGRWYDLSNLAAGEEEAIAAGGRKWGAAFRTRHDCLGFTLDVHGGPQHALAKTDFTPADSVDTDSGESRAWDEDLSLDWWNVTVTVAVEADNWAESAWPPGAVPSFEDVLPELVIQIPGKRMEYVKSGAALGVNTDGTLKETTSGGWIVDDSEELKNLARISYEWYRQTRRTVDFSIRTLDCPWRVGQLVTEIRRSDANNTLEEVNSVVTQVSLDLREGITSLKTQFAELDIRSLL